VLQEGVVIERREDNKAELACQSMTVAAKGGAFQEINDSGLVCNVVGRRKTDCEACIRRWDKVVRPRRELAGVG